MNVICISASNILSSQRESTSYKICLEVVKTLAQKNIICEILDLRDYNVSPCIGCGKCFDSKRCCKDNDFNKFYNKLIKADCVFIVSPHYAPIPAKLW